MGSLAATYAAMHAVLRGERSPEEAAGELGVDAKRLAIYQGFVQGHVRGILGEQFSRVMATMAEGTWQTLTGDFFVTHPPDDWELNEAAGPFPDYLAGRLGELDELHLFHVSLARFEWAQWSVYSDPARVPGPDEVASRVINPTLTILEVPCPVVAQVLALDRGDAVTGPLPDAGDGAEQVLLFRQPARETSAYWRASGPLILALATVDQALTPDEAAAAFGCTATDVKDALTRADEIGLCIGPAPGRGD
jgi:uncharacterized protein